MSVKELLKTTLNKFDESHNICPTCSSDVSIHSSDEGTCSYEPITDVIPTLLRIIERQREALNHCASCLCVPKQGHDETCSVCVARAALTDCDTLAKEVMG